MCLHVRGVRGVRDADRGDADIGRTTPVTAPYFGLAAGSGMCRVPRLRKGTPWFMGRGIARCQWLFGVQLSGNWFSRAEFLGHKLCC